MNPITILSALVSLGVAGASLGPLVPSGAGGSIPVIIGRDANSALNPFVQPQDKALSGGGRDQSQKFHDLLFGDVYGPSIVIGRLGADLIIGGPSIDVIVGGPEHFNPANRDKAFGLDGDDVFLWAPGDGSDRFDGGSGLDTVVFGLIGEKDEKGNTVFKVSNDQKAGEVALDGYLGLPRMNVSGSPGFCQVIDRSSSANAGQELQKIDADHLVRFFIRAVNQSFKNGQQKDDNGLRVTLTLKDVEFLVCTNEEGGKIAAFDLRTSPPRSVPLWNLPLTVRWIVH